MRRAASNKPPTSTFTLPPFSLNATPLKVRDARLRLLVAFPERRWDEVGVVRGDIARKIDAAFDHHGGVGHADQHAVALRVAQQGLALALRLGCVGEKPLSRRAGGAHAVLDKLSGMAGQRALRLQLVADALELAQAHVDFPCVASSIPAIPSSESFWLAVRVLTGTPMLRKNAT